MGDGTWGNPYTREDVLRRINRNGGTAKGLDLSGKVFKKEIDLRGIDLESIILSKSILRQAHLEGTIFHMANLIKSDLENYIQSNLGTNFTHMELERVFKKNLNFLLNLSFYPLFLIIIMTILGILSLYNYQK